MYVEDLKSPGLNVAAEIPKEEAHSFKTVCQILTTFPHQKIIDAYLTKLSPFQATGKAGGSNSSINSLTLMKANSGEAKKINPTRELSPLDSLTLKDVTKKVSQVADFVSRTDTRIENEAKIMETLTSHLKGMDSTLKAISFGSSTYGFGGRKTNFNILVNAGKNSIIEQLFKSRYLLLYYIQF